MRPKKLRTTGSGDLFRARLDQIIDDMRKRIAIGRAMPTCEQEISRL